MNLLWLAPAVPVSVWLLFWAVEETVGWRRRRRFDRHAMEALAAANPARRPQGVRLRRASGATMPLELAYKGRDEEGIDVWTVATAVDWLAGDVIQVELLPGRTTIEGEFGGDH